MGRKRGTNLRADEQESDRRRFRAGRSGQWPRSSCDQGSPAQAMTGFKARVRKLTWRSGGASLQQVVERLRSYFLGWKAYGKGGSSKGLARAGSVDTPPDAGHPTEAMAAWTTAYGELRARGARQDVALMVAGTMRRLWHNSGTPLNGVLDPSWADQLGIPRLC